MSIPSRDDRRSLLAADCSKCFGLCCVALSFQRSTDFAFDKPAGQPCVNLRTDFACGIHQRLQSSGFTGCTVFDCFGAGQKVAQDTYRGVSWRDNPDSRQQMFAVFPIARDLHELLWFLGEASEMAITGSLASDIASLYRRTEELVDLPPEQLLGHDVAAHRETVAALLGKVSEHVRNNLTHPWKRSQRSRDVGPGADLIGKTFSGDELRGANLRGSYLIAANLTGADLTATDLLGADLRDARVQGADLSASLFLTQMQVDSARGDASTSLPQWLRRPPRWG